MPLVSPLLGLKVCLEPWGRLSLNPKTGWKDRPHGGRILMGSILEQPDATLVQIATAFPTAGCSGKLVYLTGSWSNPIRVLIHSTATRTTSGIRTNSTVMRGVSETARPREPAPLPPRPLVSSPPSALANDRVCYCSGPDCLVT